MSTYIIWVWSKVTGLPILLVGNCEFTCLKFGYVSTLYRGRLGIVFLCVNMSALYVLASVLILQLQGREL